MLNDRQKAAVEWSGSCIVMAPPGSGKTRVLQERAGFLLKRDSQGRRIVGVTFTQDAAKELEARIRRQCGDVGDRLLCGTFHGLAKRQLEESGIRVKLASDAQQLAYLEQAHRLVVTDEKQTLAPFDEAVRYVESMKCSVVPIEPNARSGEKITLLHEVYETYEELLASMGLMDFSDLLALAVRGMRSGIQVHGEKRRQVAPLHGFHLLVDEMQDTDPIQMEWIRCHIEAGMGLTGVGDDDQSLYSWRRAGSYGGMLKLKEIARAEKITLNVTYRCAQDIMARAKTLIEHNTVREPKDTRSNNLSRGVIELRPHKNRDEEIEGMAEVIKLSGDRGNWVVLARNNWMLDVIETGLKAHGLDAVRRGAKGFWEGELQQTYLGLCRAVAGGDMVGIDGALRICAVSQSALDGLHQRVHSRRPGAVERFLAAERLPGVIGELQGLMRNWRAKASEGQVDLVAYDVATFLTRNGKLVKAARLGQESIKDYDLKLSVATKIVKTCGELVAKRRGTLSMRLMGIDETKERTQLDAFGEPIETVTLMTLHASKGLEFKNVWIAAAEPGLIPSKRATDIEEERRLFYVGMTRAIERLVISRSIKDSKLQFSPFVTEADLLSRYSELPVFVSKAQAEKTES